jgi:predicted metal-binding protein
MTPPTPRALAETVEPKTLQADLERYRALALNSGASQAVALPAAEVEVDERVRLKCLVPRCLRAGETPNCPPNAPDLDLVRRALARFSWAILFKCDVGPLEEYAPRRGQTAEQKRRVLSYHRPSSDVIYALEGQAYKDGYHLALGLGGGSCKDYLCQGTLCQYLDSGRCRFPHRSRPSMEAMGIDVLGLVKKVGWQAYALTGDLDEIPCGITVGIVFVY